MNQMEKTLHYGVRRIVSKFSSPDNQPLCSPFVFNVHVHEEQEICIVLSGRSRYMLDNKVYDARPGTVFLIDRRVPHAYSYLPEDENLFHMWLFVNRDSILGCIIQVHANNRMTFCQRYRTIRKEVADMVISRWEQLNQQTAPDDLTTEDYLRIPLNMLMDEFRFQVQHFPHVGTYGIESVIDLVKNHIEENRGRECSLAELEKIFGFNRYYLAHRFKDFSGYTVGQYIDQVRIEYTAAALTRGMRQNEIAFELGFSSAVHFWHWLQQHKVAIEHACKKS